MDLELICALITSPSIMLGLLLDATQYGTALGPLGILAKGTLSLSVS